MSKRVLVLSASVGGGHLRAALAVELALKELDPQATVRNVDALQLATGAFRRLYGQAYLDLVNKAPHVFGYLYDWVDRPPRKGAGYQPFTLLLEKLSLRPFLELLKGETWDLIVNTHFLPAEIVASLRRKGELTTPQMTATTDFETHRLWANPPCEHYFTATAEGAAYLTHWGVPAQDISVTGIPILPAFSRLKPRADCLERQELAGDRPIVLQLAGGFGVGPVHSILHSILDLDEPVELVVVAGRNEKLKKELGRVRVSSRHRLKVIGFTDQMDELMAVADVVVSKPGGLTSSEALACGAAMAIVNPIPGQESRNSDYLLENGAAVKINNVATLRHKLGALLRDPARLAQLKRNAQRLSRPGAAFEIARQALASSPPENV